MYLMYVDETGDTGLNNSLTRYFGLSGIVVHESDWRTFVAALVQFKRTMRQVHGLPIRAEIHAVDYLRHQIHGLQLHVRLAILRNFLDELAKFPYISITNVLVDKQGKTAGYDVFENAWKVLFQRFDNTLTWGNFPGGHRSDYGIVISDDTQGRRLTRLMRKMAVFNYVPHMQPYGPGARNIPIVRIIEDPHGKDSAESLPIQACDVCAYFLKQRHDPNKRILRHHAQYYFDRLRPVLNTKASYANAFGIVKL